MYSGYSLTIPFKEIVFSKNETFQFLIRWLHTFYTNFTKSYYLKCLRVVGLVILAKAWDLRVCLS
jgi:hypothetical protein